MERILFICSTKFLLFNALHVRMHMFPEIAADIIIDFSNAETEDYYRRVKETGVFENVAYLKPKWEGIHEYIRSIRKGKPVASLKTSIKNTISHVYKKYLYRDDPEYALKNLLFGVEKIDFSLYTHIFGQGNNATVRNIVGLVRKKNTTCKLCTLEEGTGTYVFENICDDVRSDYIYVYDPEVVVYKSDKRIKKIDRIDKNDESFIETVNYVFDYKQREKYHNSIIFFDTYAEDMPNYLKKHKWLSRTLLNNAYKKHLTEANVNQLQKNAFSLLCKYKNGKKIFVKLHPTTKRKGKEAYCVKTGIELAKDNNVPWEVVCLNGEVTNNIVVAHMTSAFRSLSLIEECDTNEYIALIDMVSIDKQYENSLVLQKWRKLKKVKLYSPKSIEEYQDVLKRLLKSNR